MTTSFADAVRAARARLGVTSAVVAECAGISSSYIRRMEMRGANRLLPNNRELVATVAIVLDEDPEYLWLLAMQDRLSVKDPDIYDTLRELGVFA